MTTLLGRDALVAWVAGKKPSQHATLVALPLDTPGDDLVYDLRRQPSFVEHERRVRASAVAPVTVVEAIPEPHEKRTVVSAGDVVAQLVLWSPAWDRASFEVLNRRLLEGPVGRRLIFLEPVAASGWRRLAQRLTSSYWQRRLGHAFDRDLPVALRRAGFMIHTLDRFSLGPLGLWTYAYGEAVVHDRARSARS